MGEIKFLNKIRVDDIEYNLSYKGAGSYGFSGDYIGHCNQRGDCSFTIPFDGNKNFKNGTITDFKAYILGVNGALKYQNSTDAGLTDFTVSNFEVSVFLGYNIFNVYIKNNGTQPTNLSINTPYCILLESLTINFT